MHFLLHSKRQNLNKFFNHFFFLINSFKKARFGWFGLLKSPMATLSISLFANIQVTRLVDPFNKLDDLKAILCFPLHKKISFLQRNVKNGHSCSHPHLSIGGNSWHQIEWFWWSYFFEETLSRKVFLSKKISLKSS